MFVPYGLISYSRCDNTQGHITELVERINQDFASLEEMQGGELRVFFGQDEIHGVSEWRQRILHFIGRTANLRMLRENFVKPGHIGVVTALNGMGGLGKTALAIEYARAFVDEHGGGRWQVRCPGRLLPRTWPEGNAGEGELWASWVRGPPPVPDATSRR